MVSDFVLRVIHLPSGKAVEWAPGQQVESQLVDELCSRVTAKGVGVGRTEAQVVAKVREAMTELLHHLKSQV